MIAYGSLYPFNFQFEHHDFKELLGLDFDRGGLFKLGDLLANVVLFIPYGFFGFIVTTIGANKLIRLLAIAFGGILFSVLLQFLQLYLPDRVVSVSDVVWNTLGIILGITMGAISWRWLSSVDRKIKNWYSPQGFLVVSWLAFELIPFVPTLQVDLIRDNIKSFLNTPFSTIEMLLHLVAWITVGYLIRSISNKNLIFPMLILLTLGAKIVLVANQITPSALIGGILAILFWWPFVRYIKEHNKIVMLPIFLISIVSLNALAPFEFKAQTASFGWLPFSGFLDGSMLLNSQALCEKFFLYGSIIWFVRTTTSSFKAAAIFVAFWTLLIEITQLFVKHHTPEITDPILVAIVAFILHLIETRTLQNKDLFKQDIEESARTREISSIGKSAGINSRVDVKSMLIPFGIAVGVVTVLTNFILSQPQIPYNIKEMFLGNGSIFAIIIFSAALLWIGMSGALSTQLIQSSRYQLLSLPGYIFFTGLVSLALLYISVTEETIADITGSTNLIWQVTKKRIWGEFGSMAFAVLDAPWLINFIERIVRYLALYSPIVFSLTLFSIFADQARLNISALPFKTIYLICASLPWFILCKIIAFDYSSTDNLNELIARPGEHNLGGGGYLYLLLFLITFNAVIFSRINIRKFFYALSVFVITLLAIPIGWYLLNKGLVTNFKKYDTAYSGVDFLLGPDRRNLLSQTELYVRWSLLQLGSVVFLAYGLMIVKRGFSNTVIRESDPTSNDQYHPTRI